MIVSAMRLDTADTVYAVDEGEVMLFAVPASRDGTRRPIGVVPEGGLMFGAAPSPFGGEIVLAVPEQPGGLRSIDWPAADDDPGTFASGVAGWVSILSAGINDAVEVKPRPDLLLPSARRRQLLTRGYMIAAHETPSWLVLPPGTAELYGLVEIGGLVPFAPGAWFTVIADGEVETLAWSEGLARADARAALGAFHEAISEVLPIVRGFADADELNRVRAQETAERQDRARIGGRLAATVDRRQRHDETVREGLLDLIRLVAKDEGLRVVRPSRVSLAQQDAPATLEEIARASGFRFAAGAPCG